MAVIEIVEESRYGLVHKGLLDTESDVSRQVTNTMIRDLKMAHYIVRAIDETGSGRPVGTVDDVRETDRTLKFDRPPML